MKKIIMLLVTGLLMVVTTLTFAGCGNGKTLVVATNAMFPPFEYLENGKYKGVDMAIAELFANDLGWELEVKDMEFDSVLVAVASGNCDIGMAGLTITETRKQSVDFSDTYFNASQMVIAKSGDTRLDGKDADEIISELEGKKIGVMFGYTGQFFVEGDEDFDFEGIANADVTTFSNGSLAVNALKNGTVDYVIIDNVPAASLVAKNTGVKLVDVPLTEEEYAFAVKKGNTSLLNKVNALIAKIKTNGQLDEIVATYF